MRASLLVQEAIFSLTHKQWKTEIQLKAYWSLILGLQIKDHNIIRYNNRDIIQGGGGGGGVKISQGLAIRKLYTVFL